MKNSNTYLCVLQLIFTFSYRILFSLCVIGAETNYNFFRIRVMID
ncbi:hypothetical protein E18064_310031 [Elizabethkingia anophelis]|nr:hypothetical protein E18064_310031 [Elizabethkingia anophelis]